MKRLGMFALLLAMLAATPVTLVAQNKAWATLSDGVLTFSYGPKPKAPTQVTCPDCGKKMSYSTNFCSNCGTKNPKDFAVYDVMEKIKCSWCSEARHKPWFDRAKEIKKVVFTPSFKQVTNITSMENWFSYMRNLTSIVGLEYLNTAKVTNMSSMFQDCYSLKTIDLSHFNTANVTDMNKMFWGCKSLTSLNLSHFKTDKVTNMEYMFSDCESLTSLDLSHFKTDNVTEMGFHGMFNGCKSLVSINLSSFNTSKATNLDGMFGKCQSLTSIDLSSFNTGNVTSFASMFEDCKSLTTLDISNFDTRKADYTAFMFEGCVSLKTVYVSSANWVGLRYHRSTYQPTLMGRGCNATIIKK
ncbi:MAG: BspA family leucine-rich repeat surface protein [Bacteroidales bacterium]|nr:BspA family leucine-rich repeat surface protein [Bacteroidales bacterium]